MHTGHGDPQSDPELKGGVKRVNDLEKVRREGSSEGSPWPAASDPRLKNKDVWISGFKRGSR